MKKAFLAALAAAPLLFGACNGGQPKANLKSEVDTLSYAMGMVLAPTEQELANYLKMSGSDSAYVDEFMKGYNEGLKSGENKKEVARLMGLMQGLNQSMQMSQMEAQVFQGDSTKKVSLKNFAAGFNAYVDGKTALKDEAGKLIDKEGANKLIMSYMFGKQRQESEAFMAKKAKEQGVKKLPGGTLYKVITNSESTERVKATDSVRVKYEGKLVNGTVFDNSQRQPGGVAVLCLKDVVKGWQAALPQMPVGATWELYIPYDQAYGETGRGAIAPYSALIFTVTLEGKAK